MKGVVVFLGPPGVGKGTQAGLLREKLDAIHISTGALLRSEIESGSELGLSVKGVMAKGDLVSDDQLFGCLENTLDRDRQLSEKLVILDGVPRTRSQVSRLDEVLSRRGLKVALAISLVAPVEKLVARFAHRWSCQSCGSVFSFETAPDSGSKCEKCGAQGAFYRRDDDGEKAVRYRFSVYHEETAPLLDVYRERELLQEVDGLAEAGAVFEQIRAKIVKCFDF